MAATIKYLRIQRGLSKRVQVDNGSEFISKASDLWAYEHQVTLDFSRPDNQRIMRISSHLMAASVMSA